MLLNVFAVLILIFIVLLTLTAIVSLFIRTPYVPSKQRVIDRLLKIAKLKKGEKFVDLGCGDGRLLFTAEKKYRVQGEGYEIAPLVYLLAIIRKIFTRSRSQIHFRNFFHCSLKNANTIVCYLMPGILAELSKKIKKECRRGTQILTHTFQMQGLKPIKVFEADKRKKIPKIYLYKI